MIADNLTSLITFREVEITEYASFYSLSSKDSSKSGYYHFYLEKPWHTFWWPTGYKLQDTSTKQYIPTTRQERQRLLRAIKDHLANPEVSTEYTRVLQKAYEDKVKEITNGRL